LRLLNQLCPEGWWEIGATAPFDVKSKSPNFCTGRKGKFGPGEPPLCESSVFVRHPVSCKCICNAINMDQRIILKRWDKAGGQAQPAGEVRTVEVGAERPKGYAGKDDPNPPMENKGAVRANQMIILGHELCAHAVAGLRHGDAKAPYTLEDPSIKVENDIRKEHNMGVRTGLAIP
jgi:hypothetical protein